MKGTRGGGGAYPLDAVVVGVAVDLAERRHGDCGVKNRGWVC